MRTPWSQIISQPVKLVKAKDAHVAKWTMNVGHHCYIGDPIVKFSTLLGSEKSWIQGS